MKRPLTTSLAVPPPDQLQTSTAEPADGAPPPSWRDTAPILDTATGEHHYTAGTAETAAFEKAQAGGSWVHEGAAFTVHAPSPGMLDL